MSRPPTWPSTAKYAPHADDELDKAQLKMVAGGGQTTMGIATATTANSYGAFIVY